MTDFILPKSVMQKGPDQSIDEDNPKDFMMAKTIADTLDKHYPGYMWAVTASQRTGVIHILSLRLSGKYGYLLHYKDVEDDVSGKLIIRAGGEILERFKVRIGAVDNAQLDGKRMIAGEYAFDYQELKNGKVSDAVRMRWDHFQ